MLGIQSLAHSRASFAMPSLLCQIEAIKNKLREVENRYTHGMFAPPYWLFGVGAEYDRKQISRFSPSTLAPTLVASETGPVQSLAPFHNSYVFPVSLHPQLYE